MSGGKGGKTTTGYTYYAGFQMVLARCIEKILRIRVDKNSAVEGIFGPGIIHINAPDLFGGSNGADPQGGVVGDVNFQQGFAGQMPDSYLVSKIATSSTDNRMTASRGVAAIVGHQLNLGSSPYMKDWEIRSQRVHILDDGSPQWYDAKAAIPIPVAASSIADEVGTFTVPAGAVYHNGATIFGDPTAGFSGDATFVAQSCIAAYNRAQGTEWPYGGCNYFIDPTFGPSIVGWSLAFGSSVGLAAIAVTAVCEVNFSPEVDGDSGALGLANPTVVCSVVEPTVLAMNPAHIMRECLLNDEWGYGYLESDLDDASFRDCADKLYLEEFGLGYFWDDETVSLDDVTDMIEDHVDCVVYVDRETLLWTMKLIRADYDQSTLDIVSTSEEIISIDNFKRPQFMELVNTVVVNYFDMVLDSNSSITLPNPALLLQQGVKIDKQSDYNMVCHRTLASRLAQRDLKVESNPAASGTLNLTPGPKTNKLRRGSVIKVNAPEFGMNDVVVRITSVTIGDGVTRRIKAVFAEDLFSLPDTAIISPTPPPFDDSGTTPLPLINRLPMELPYFYLIRAFGASEVNNELSIDPGAGTFGICADRISGAFNASIYVDPGSGYARAGTLDFCPFGHLLADIGKLDTTLTLVNFEDVEDADSLSMFQIDDEIMSFESYSAGVLTGLKRGLFDTVPKSHTATAKVFFFDHYLDSDQVQYGDGDVVNIKLATYSAKGELALSSAPVDTVTFNHRAIRPYPPSKLRINGLAYPTSVTGPFSVAWAHRDRLTQQDVVVDTNEGSTGPETGTTYTIKVYIGGMLDQTITAISGTSQSITPTSSGAVMVVVFAERDGYESWQGHDAEFSYTASSDVSDRVTRDGSTRITRDSSNRVTH